MPRRCGAFGRGLPERATGVGTLDFDTAVIRDGPAALVPFRLGRRGAVGPGDPAGGRDFCRWLALREKPARPPVVSDQPAASEPGDWQAGLGRKYAVATRAHSETVLRVFYDFHRDAGTGPMVNPFPLFARAPGGDLTPSQPDGAFRNDRVGFTGQESPSGSTLLPMRCYACSPSSAAIVTGHWSRCGCRPERVPRSCSAPAAATSTRAAAHHSDPQGNPRNPTASGVAGRVRVASALPVRNQPGATVWT